MTYIFQTMRVELEQAIKKHAHLLSGRILDVGAGSYDRYSGCFKASEYVRMNLTQGEGTQLVGCIEEIPAADGSFDGIVCTQVLGDVYNVREALAECNRVLKVGGKMLLTESFMDPLHDEPHDYWRFTPHSLRKLFEEAGFTVEVLERIGGYHSTRVQFAARHAIEKHHLYNVWYRRFASLYFKLRSQIAMWRDARGTGPAQKLFAQGWIVVAEKTA